MPAASGSKSKPRGSNLIAVVVIKQLSPALEPQIPNMSGCHSRKVRASRVPAFCQPAALRGRVPALLYGLRAVSGLRGDGRPSWGTPRCRVIRHRICTI